MVGQDAVGRRRPGHAAAEVDVHEDEVHEALPRRHGGYRHGGYLRLARGYVDDLVALFPQDMGLGQPDDRACAPRGGGR